MPKSHGLQPIIVLNVANRWFLLGEVFHVMQTQLLQTFVQNICPNPHQAPPRDKRGEFMKGHPPTFSHASDPVEADD